ncbi:dihydropteroate synthase, partial [Acinetobacter baumannii]|uniref:dihydropteroate synthase n=1 Tax=Acinetobacter baumannii TaxID=470 RepID=UPI003F93177B
PAYGPQNDVTLKMPAFEWVHVQLHQQKGMISLSPPTICNSAIDSFQPETQRYALKRGVGYLNDIQGFPDPALYPDIAEADCRL